MKSKIIILLLMLGCFIGAHAQESDIAIAKAFYQFSYIDDSTKRDHPLVSDMVLYIGKKGSLYRRALEEESKLLLFIAEGGTKDNFDIIEESAAQTFIGSKSYQVERIIDNKYIIVEDKPEIAWTLHDDTKNIGGYAAQKATATFGGRYYTAWFTPDIPFSSGPWKLQGLPGLILEASDSKNDVVFQFKGFEAIKDGEPVKIAAPKSFKFKKVTFREFEDIRKKFNADPEGFIKGTSGSNQKVVRGGSVSGGNVKKVHNNPIETRSNE